MFLLEANVTINLQEQEKADGVTTTGKPVVEPRENREGEECKKCGQVGEELWVCSVSRPSFHC